MRKYGLIITQNANKCVSKLLQLERGPAPSLTPKSSYFHCADYSQPMRTAAGNWEEDTGEPRVTRTFSKIPRRLLCSSKRKNQKNYEAEIKEDKFGSNMSKHSTTEGVINAATRPQAGSAHHGRGGSRSGHSPKLS